MFVMNSNISSVANKFSRSQGLAWEREKNSLKKQYEDVFLGFFFLGF